MKILRHGVGDGARFHFFALSWSIPTSISVNEPPSSQQRLGAVAVRAKQG